MFETITSIQNPRVKSLVRLRDGTHRRRRQRFLIEGYRECRRALACRWPMETLFFCEDRFKHPDSFELVEDAEAAGLEMVRLGKDAFDKAAYREGPDGLLATGIERSATLADLPLSPVPFVVILEGVEKPGNIGAVFRTANAAGADALILAEPVADPYNPNAIRAAQGAFFELPFAMAANIEVMDFLEQKGISPVPTSPDGRNILWEVDLTGPVALVLGSENTGLSPDWLDGFTACRLPMHGISDSLNIASMAAVAVFETVRQRSGQ